MNISEEDYLRNRVDDQIKWYGKKSQNNQKLYKSSIILNAICASLIPILSAYVTEQTVCLKIFIAGLGILITISTVLLSLYKFQENWIQYRVVSETLKHEKFLYLTASGKYCQANKFNLFVEQTEKLISTENNNWAQLFKKSKNGELHV
jgi:hypothetical protein